MASQKNYVFKSQFLYLYRSYAIIPAVMAKIMEDRDDLTTEDLDAEIKERQKGLALWGDDEEYVKILIDDVARHFYEFGKSSRPKESDSLEELEKEVIKFWNDHSLEYRLGRVADIDFLHLCARHFADWGSKHLKK